MTIPIKFRGKPVGSERPDRQNRKFVYGGYFRDKQGNEFIITYDEWWRVTNVAQLVGYDCYRREVYTGDVLLDEIDNEHVARLGDNPSSLATMRLEN